MPETLDEERSKRRGDVWLVILSVIVCLAVAFVVSLSDRSLIWQLLRGRPVGIVKTKQEIKRRPATTLHWDTLRDGDSLYARDVLYVPAGGQAFVFLGGKRKIELPQDSTVQIVVAPTGESEVVRLSRRTSPFEVLALARHATTQLGFDDNLAKKMEELTTRLVAMKPVPLAEATFVAPAPLFPDRADDFELVLIKPVGKKFHLDPRRYVDMAWTPVPLAGTLYKVEVARDEAFFRSVSHETKSSEIRLKFDRPAVYHWRVYARLKGETLVSEPATFTVTARGGEELPAPVGFVANDEPAEDAHTGRRPAKARRRVASKGWQPHELDPYTFEGNEAEFSKTTTVANPPPADDDEEEPEPEPAPTKREAPPKRATASSELPEGMPSGYTAEVSLDDSFTKIVAAAVVPNTKCPVDRLPPGHYYCRLTSIDGGQKKVVEFNVKGD